MYVFLILILLIFNGMSNGLPLNPVMNNIENLLIMLMFFNLVYMPKREVFTIVCMFVLYKLYILITSMFIQQRPFLMVYIENMVFLFVLMFQHYKNYNLKSSKISSKTVCLVFYRPKSFGQYFISLFGTPVASVGAIIGLKMYMLDKKYPTLQERSFDEKHIRSRYLIIDTGVNIEKVLYVIPELLKQKARQPRTLYLRYNCLRCLIPLLNALGGKWEYKGEFFPSIWLKNRVDLIKR